MLLVKVPSSSDTSVPSRESSRPVTMFKNTEVPVNYSESMLSFLSDNGPRESTRQSFDNDIIDEEISTRPSAIEPDADISVNGDITADQSTFDVERPHRSLVVEEIENSIADETVHRKDVKDMEAETTFSVVTTFVTDFEQGIWQGIRAAFHEPVIYGCAFHFGQALWRKVQEFGLQSDK